MMRTTRSTTGKAFLIFGSLFLFIPIAFAVTYDTSPLPYTDADEMNVETAVAVSVMTEAGVLEGNPDGTFRADAQLNRAEFVKIVMAFMPSDNVMRTNCFPDVDNNAWYAQVVCRAKASGIIRGDARADLPASAWRFSPSRSVNYAEAVKILVHAFAVPTITVDPGEVWYVPYIRAADEREIGLEALTPATLLTRGEMAMLAASFYADAHGELALLREAQGEEMNSSSVSSSRSSMPSVSSHSMSSSSRSSVVGGVFDPNTNLTQMSQHLLLGSTTSVLGSATVFSNSEPIDVDSINITLSDAVTSLDHFIIYDVDARLLGNARLDSAAGGNTTYRLTLGNQNLQIPYRENYRFYVRGVLKGFAAGGVSNESLQINSMTLQGDGAWSNRTYTQSATGTFPRFETARAVISKVENAGIANETLIAGNNQEIGSFRFTGMASDPSADVRITDLSFNLGTIGGVTVTNVRLGADGTSDRISCTVSSNTITCPAIPASFGTLEDQPRTLTLYADVSIPANSVNPALQVSLNDPGTITTPGAVTWTDGSATFDWIGSESPLARGTYYSQ